MELNKTYDNANVKDQMFWETELKLPQDGILMKENWPEKDEDVISHRLTIVLYPGIQGYINQNGKKFIKLIPKNEKTCAGIIRWLSSLFKSIPGSH